MVERGTFNVSRAIWTHDAFAHEPFTEREAFMWIVSEASWKPRTKRMGKYTANLDRGQLFASVRFLAVAWGWSKSKTSRFLLRLKKRDMLRTDTGTVVLTITVCNYDEYQNKPEPRGTVAGQLAGQERDSSGTVAGQTRIKEEGKKVKIDTNVSTKKTARGIPSDWHISPALMTWTIGQGLSESEANLEADQFRDHWRAATKNATSPDWNAKWRTWIRNAVKWKPQKRRDGNERSNHIMQMAHRIDQCAEAKSEVDSGAGDGDDVSLLPAAAIS